MSRQQRRLAALACRVWAAMTMLAGVALIGPASALAAGVFAQTNGGAGVSATTESLSGYVEAGDLSTRYYAQYALGSSAWCSSGGSGGSPTASAPQSTSTDGDVTVQITGLASGTSYCGELVATNASGTVQGTQITFTAGAPAAETDAVSPTAAGTATVTGNANPAGQQSTVQVQYDLQSSAWCSGGGVSGSPASTTPATSLGSSGAQNQQVSVALSGLTGGTAYCAQVVVTNPAGSAQGGQIDFSAGVPTASTEGVTATGAGTARVDGNVYPAGQATTDAVQYDLQSSGWCASGGTSGSPTYTSAAQSLAQSDDQNHSLSISVSGLAAGRQYCAQIVATNPSGTAPGGLLQFTAGAPVVDTDDVNATASTTATLDGDINPSGQTTTYEAEYDRASSNWCATDGASGSPAGTTAVATLSAGDDTSHDVSVTLTGLTAGTDYCALLAATNASAGQSGTALQFTAGSPSAVTSQVTPTAPTTASVSGQVDPAGQSTTLRVDYDLADSNWCDTGNGAATDSTAGQTLTDSDSAEHSVTVGVSGLTAGLSYCAQLVATNASSASVNSRVTFTAGAPTVTTDDAGAVGATAATIDGTVSPASVSTAYEVQYDLATSDWCQFGGATPGYTTAPQTLPASDSAAHSVSVGLSGLSVGTQYCAELVAGNGWGSSGGAQVSFTTAGSSPPAVSATSAGALTATSAVVSGTIVPSAQATTYQFDYGVTASYGASSAPAGAGSGSAAQPESTTLSGLAPDTTYHVRLQATNPSGTTDGPDQTFTTPVLPPPPPPTTPTPTPIAAPPSTSTSPPTTTPRTTAPGAPASTTHQPSAPTAVTASASRCAVRTPSTSIRLTAPARGHAPATPVGTVALTVTCGAAASVGVTGTLSIAAKRNGRTAKQFTLSSARTAVRAGVATTVDVKLPAAALRALGSSDGAVHFSLTASTAQGATSHLAWLASLRAVSHSVSRLRSG